MVGTGEDAWLRLAESEQDYRQRIIEATETGWTILESTEGSTLLESPTGERIRILPPSNETANPPAKRKREGYNENQKVPGWLKALGWVTLAFVAIESPLLALGILLLVLILRAGRTPKPNVVKVEADTRRAAESKQRWCPECNRNVTPVRGPSSAGRLVTWGVLGYALKELNACPICKSETLESRRLVEG